MQKLLLKRESHTTLKFSSFTLRAETEKVSFQPPIQAWQAWLNNAVNAFSDSRYIFYGASMYVKHIWALTDSSLSTLLPDVVLWLPTHTQVLHVLYLSSVGGRPQRDGLCIFSLLLSSWYPPSCQANSKETGWYQYIHAYNASLFSYDIVCSFEMDEGKSSVKFRGSCICKELLQCYRFFFVLEAVCFYEQHYLIL